jgi:hypothetical protein
MIGVKACSQRTSVDPPVCGAPARANCLQAWHASPCLSDMAVECGVAHRCCPRAAWHSQAARRGGMIQKPMSVDMQFPVPVDSMGPMAAPRESSTHAAAAGSDPRSTPCFVLDLWARWGRHAHRTEQGDYILAYKALSKEGNQPYGYEFVMMTGSKPYFVVLAGQHVPEKRTSLASPNIYNLETDPGSAGHDAWTYRYKDSYDGLLFSATKERKQSRAGNKPRAGDTQCAVMWKDGTFDIMPRSSFGKVCPENGDTVIGKSL